jgi:RNA polymerase sigma-70 factor (family 1)
LHPNQHTYEEAKLILLLANDSEYAFQFIYERYRNRIYHTAVRYLKSPVLAQETVQDVFLKLWLERKNINPAKPIEAWLYTVAKNNVMNRLKRIAIEWKSLHQLQLISSGSESRTSDKVEDSQYNKLLQQALMELPTQQQKIFCMARQEHLTYIQIGEKLGLSPLTVKTHMSRALNHIKAYLTAHGETFFLFLIIPATFF